MLCWFRECIVSPEHRLALARASRCIRSQFAYSLAAAHLGLSHQTAASLMVSDIEARAGDEDWSFIDGGDGTDLCADRDGKTLLERLQSIPSSPSNQQLPRSLPHVLHYCSTAYGVGYWYFSKYDLPDQFLSCQHPLLREPTRGDAVDALSRYPAHFFCPVGSYFYPDGEPHEFRDAEVAPKRGAFMTCEVLRALNGAAIHYKARQCSPAQANLRKTFTFHPPDKYTAAADSPS
jgi:hypothetical protein